MYIRQDGLAYCTEEGSFLRGKSKEERAKRKERKCKIRLRSREDSEDREISDGRTNKPYSP